MHPTQCVVFCLASRFLSCFVNVSLCLRTISRWRRRRRRTVEVDGGGGDSGRRRGLLLRRILLAPSHPGVPVFFQGVLLSKKKLNVPLTGIKVDTRGALLLVLVVCSYLCDDIHTRHAATGRDRMQSRRCKGTMH